MSFDFAELVGQEFDFYGIDGHRFRLDDVTYEVVVLDDLGVHEDHEVIISPVSIEGLPIARVTVENVAFSDDSYEIKDLHDDHVWLEFGTAYEEVASDGNPYFIFDYTPKGPLD